MTSGERPRGPFANFDELFGGLKLLEADPACVAEVRQVISPSDQTPQLPVIEVYESTEANRRSLHWLTDVGIVSESSKDDSHEKHGRGRRGASLNDFQVLNQNWIINRMSTFANGASELALVVGYLSEKTQNSLSPSMMPLSKTVENSLRFLGNTASQEIIIEAFRAEPAADYKRKHIGTVLGKMLLGVPLTQHHRYRFSPEALVHGFEGFDKAGLISPETWIRYGIVAAGAVKMPGFLPLLHKKLQAGIESHLPQTEVQARRMAQDYASEVLGSLVNNPLRNREVVLQILRRSQIGGAPSESIQSWRLIAVSNEAVKSQNRNQPEARRMALLHPERLGNMPLAFLRLLRLTRLSDAQLPPGAGRAQLEQDLLHAGVIASVIGTTPNFPGDTADIYFQAPALPPEQIAAAQARLAEGARFSDAMRETRMRYTAF